MTQSAIQINQSVLKWTVHAARFWFEHQMMIDYYKLLSRWEHSTEAKPQPKPRMPMYLTRKEKVTEILKPSGGGVVFG